MLVTRIKHPYFWLLTAIGTSLTAELLLAILMSSYAAKMALLGTCLWALPQFYFVRKILVKNLNSAPTETLKNFYKVELKKLLITGILFVVFAKTFKIVILWLLIGYITPHIAFSLIAVTASIKQFSRPS